MDKAKIILEELKEWIYNDENQAGEKLQIIDGDDIFSITENIVKKLNLHDAGLSLPSDELINENVGSGEPLEQWLTGNPKGNEA